MTPLERYIRRRITLEGPITIGDFMVDALGHPEHGYYIACDPFGRAGDFITAPEVSQIFGELIGLWVAEVWQGLGSPDEFALVELGPGRGTLMADLLRALKVSPGAMEAARIRLVEMSPALRARQRKALSGHDVVWHDTVYDLPELPTIFIANEFFDALPIRQLERTGNGWRERVVAIEPEMDRLIVTLAHGPSPLEPMMNDGIRDEGAIGDIAELSPASWSIATQLGAHLALWGGAGLIIDYGHGGGVTGDTLQAVKDHQYAPVLEDIGLADITAHVDFGKLAAAFVEGGSEYRAFTSQGGFLNALGINVRAGMIKAKNPAGAEAVDATVRRLIGEDQMGTLFKVLGVAAPGTPELPVLG